ncbi:FAD-dependent oxidoreductase [Megalodesulfovibrio paquesii]
MPRFDYDIGVIGAGAAGLSFTAGAARLGVKVALIERREVLGGDCLHFGCVPSKTLIKSAHVHHLLQNAPRYGLPAVQLQPVDFRQVAARIRQVIAAIQPHDSPERFRSLGADVLFGQAHFTDPHTIQLAGRRLTARRWIVAAGARPALPAIPGLETVRYLTNETLFSMDTLPPSLLILGGGAIAVELAQALQRLGSKVTLLQRGEQLLSKEDPDMAALVRAALEQDGVAVHTGMTLDAVSQEQDQTVAIATNALGQRCRFASHALLLAMGRQANVEGLGLSQAGVRYRPNGIAVDSRMRTSQPHILAIGDITGAYQFTHAAGYEAGVALVNAVFRLPRRADYTRMPRATFTAPEFAALGPTEAALTAAGVEHTVWKESFAQNDRSQAEGETEGVLKVILDGRQRPLAVQVFGQQAAELLGEWAVALGGRVGLGTLASVVRPYPTRGEIGKRLAGAVLAPRLFEGIAPRALRLLFGYRGQKGSRKV